MISICKNVLAEVLALFQNPFLMLRNYPELNVLRALPGIREYYLGLSVTFSYRTGT